MARGGDGLSEAVELVLPFHDPLQPLRSLPSLTNPASLDSHFVGPVISVADEESSMPGPQKDCQNGRGIKNTLPSPSSLTCQDPVLLPIFSFTFL